MGRQFQFHVERLDVFKVTLEFITWVRTLDRNFLGGADRENQLRRAADSIALNLAEGVGRGPGKSRAYHFGVARGSASECAAVLAVLRIHGKDVAAGREQLGRIGAMINGLLRK